MIRICSFIATVIMLISSISVGWAYDNTPHIVALTDATSSLSDFGTVSVKQCLQLNGKEYPLYCTFDDVDSAITAFEQCAESLLAFLKSAYNLSDFSSQTVNEYYAATIQMLDSQQKPEWYTDSAPSLTKFFAFYDIYENNEKNGEIADYVLACSSNYRSRSSISTTNNNVVDSMLMLLPYNSAAAIVRDNSAADKAALDTYATRASSFNISAAVTYAENRATLPNTLEYEYLYIAGDCANFASQILEKGGVAQVVTNSITTGWWHKTSISEPNGITVHTRSNSWVGADAFFKYHAVSLYTTSNHYNFSNNIEKGDFVALDFTKDGDWDHIGFVTDTKATTGTLGYFDYEIAQHTTNYLAWASSSTNNWDLGEDNGYRYGRIRF